MNFIKRLLTALTSYQREVAELNRLADICQSGTLEEARAASKRMQEIHNGVKP